MALTQADERHIICEMHAQAPHRDAVKALLLELLTHARTEPGNLSYNIMENAKDPLTFYILDGWESEQAYMVHHDSAHVADVVKRMAPLLEGTYSEDVTVRVG